MHATDRPAIDALVTFFYCTDGARTWAFYEDVVGLPLVVDQGGCRIYRVAAEGYIGFCQRAEARPTDGVILTLVSDDVDGWERHLRAHGVEVVTPARVNEEYGIYHLFARDPSGYLLEVQRFLDPGWRG
jgi:predicted enzyme related to lactoylglutathione lyase